MMNDKVNKDVKTIRLIGRNSKLSLIQLYLVKQKIETHYPNLEIEIIARSSRGDNLQNIPLQTVEGSDFFTQDIFDALQTYEADIAVHSLKDMSSEHFFGNNKFAVVDRDDVRDVAIFNKNIQEKLRNGHKVVIGTCSPRREEMAINFLQKALPQFDKNFVVETKIIRGNVDTRLRKLDIGDYDGIILATAGINRLLKSDEDALMMKTLLADKLLMILPIIECVPAPCQGAIVAESISANKFATKILDIINNNSLMAECVEEKKTGVKYGIGCLQKFGVTSINYGDKSVIYAAGKDSVGNTFSKWTPLPKLNIAHKNFFSTTDFMGSFFDYNYNKENIEIKEETVYVANYKAIKNNKIIEQLQLKKVWAAGSKTWFELANKNIWVQGSADAFGLDFLIKPWQMPLVNIDKNKIAIITNNESALQWKNKKWKTYGTYTTSEKKSEIVAEQIKKADIIFWTSIRQYQQYKNLVKEGVQNVCPYGETAEQFKVLGINTIVFPNIKAFIQWKQTVI
jgi:hydroxymethylbilane synthase